MATYTVKIDGVAVVTGQSQNGVTGYPCALYPNSSRGANVTWNSAFYCWMFDIGGTAYYQYGTLLGPLRYSGCAAQTKLTTPRMGGFTTFYRTVAGVSALAKEIGSSLNIPSGTIYDAGGGSHTLSVEAVEEVVVKKYNLTVQVVHSDGSTATSTRPIVTVGGSTKSPSSSTTSGGARVYVYSDIEDGSKVKVKHPSAASGYVLSKFMINSGTRSYSSSGHSFDISASTTVQIEYNKLHTITLSVGSGGGSISASSTTSYTGVTDSGTATGSSTTISAEEGQPISLSASAADGYVLYSNAITSSASGYGNISGSGTTSVSGSKTCVSNTTFTVSGQQFVITPSIATSAQSGWGTPLINGSSGSAILKPNTTYTLGFSSSTADTLAASVNYWSIGGSNYSTSFTTGNSVTSNITAYLYLTQTKWQLTVANGTNSSWGGVYLGSSGTATSGWYASGTDVTVRFVSALSSTIAPTASQINYNGSTSTCGNTATITTTNASLTATMYLMQTRWRMGIAYGNSGTSGWGAIAFKRSSDSTWNTGTSSKIYVSTGDRIDLKFTPDSSLASTIHPQLDHWTFLLQTASPSAADDGSSSTTVTLGAVSSDFTAYAYLNSSWRKVSIRRSDSGSSAWGSFYLGTSGSETTAYYPPGSTITMRFDRNTNYDLRERPQVDSIAIGTENVIAGSEGTFSYTYTLPAGVKSDLTISGVVKQTAWPVSLQVDTTSIASLTARRIDISSGRTIASVSTSNASQIYLRYGNTEYLALTPSAKEHYDFYRWEKTGLVDYNYNQSYVRLANPLSAVVKAVGERNDFCVTVRSDNTSLYTMYMQDSASTTTYYPKSTTTNPVVICKIDPNYADQYRVSSFLVGGNNVVPHENPAGGFYYVEIIDRMDVTVTANVVPTHFNLTVSVGPDNNVDFGDVIVKADDQTLSKGEFSGRLREGSRVSIVFFEKYGGRTINIQPSSEIAQPAQSESAIEFDMPSADCSVAFTLGPKETYSLTVGVVNDAEGEAAVIPGLINVISRTYPDIVIGSTGEDGVAKTFQVYKDEEYSLVATGINETLTRRYSFIGWRDEDNAIEGALDLTHNVLNYDEPSITRYAAYTVRESGTITIEYAQKVGETITAIDDPDLTKYLLTITNETDKYGDDHWLIGADIDIGYTVNGSAYDEDNTAYKWTPIQVDVAIDGDDYVSPNAIWDDGLLSQEGSFKMLGNMKVRLVLTLTEVQGYVAMTVGIRNSPTLMGEVSIFSTEMDAYTSNHSGATVLVKKESKAVIMAAPRPGYAFAGWFTFSEGVWTVVEGAKAVYEIDYVTSPMTVYYAQFVASTVSNLKEWNGSPAIAKTCEWRSKVYVGAQYFRLSCCRVYADAYPVTLEIFMATSPNGVFSNQARTSKVVIRDQNPRRLPMIRPEKYFAFKVSGYSRINHIGLASSMEALK